MINNVLSNLMPAHSVQTVFKNEDYDFKINCFHMQDMAVKMIHTVGLSQTDQRKYHEDAETPFIELYFLLPDYWDLEKEPWPITWLNRIAQLPQKKDTWFSVGDTIPAGKPVEAISTQLKAKYFIISEPILLESVFKYKDEISHIVQPLAIIPLYEQEWKYKIRKGTSRFFEKLKKAGQNEFIDNYREPVTRKGLLRL